MDEEWDAEGKELPPIPPPVGANKWEGEDEEEEVKESWEDEEEEEKKDVEKNEAPKASQQKKAKKIRAEKIEEKERKLQEELERKAKLREQQKDLSPAELQAERLRQQQLQEEADLRVAMETFGSAESSGNTGIEAMNPTTEEEFDVLQKALIKKINSCNKSQHFPAFAEELIRNICVNLSSNDLKKLKTTVENMFLEKSKLEKGDKTKKKGKGKVKLRVEGDNVSSATLVNDYYNEYDEFDDFM